MYREPTNKVEISASRKAQGLSPFEFDSDTAKFKRLSQGTYKHMVVVFWMTEPEYHALIVKLEPLWELLAKQESLIQLVKDYAYTLMQEAVPGK